MLGRIEGSVTHKKLLLRPVGTLCPRQLSANGTQGGSRFTLERTVDVLLRASEVNRLHATHLLRRADDGGPSLPRQAPASGREGPLLDGRRRHLAAQLRAERPGEASGGHCRERENGGESVFCLLGAFSGGGVGLERKRVPTLEAGWMGSRENNKMMTSTCAWPVRTPVLVRPLPGEIFLTDFGGYEQLAVGREGAASQ